MEMFTAGGRETRDHQRSSPVPYELNVNLCATSRFHCWCFTQIRVYPPNEVCADAQSSLLVTTLNWKQPKCPPTGARVSKMACGCHGR